MDTAEAPASLKAASMILVQPQFVRLAPPVSTLVRMPEYKNCRE